MKRKAIYNALWASAIVTTIITMAVSCSRTVDAGVVFDMKLSPEVQEEETSKATLINDVLGLQDEDEGFYVEIYNQDGTQYKANAMTWDTDKWIHKGDDSSWLWPEGTEYAFFAYFPAGLSNAPEITKDGLGEYNYDTSCQTDVMFGYYKGEGNKGVAPILFKHPLASLNFVVGDMVGVGIINGVAVDGICKNGVCTPSEDCTSFKWAAGTDFTGSYDCPDLDLEPVADSVIGEPYLMIPMTIGTENKLTVHLSVTAEDGTEYELPAILKSAELVAGKTTTCTVNCDLSSMEIDFTCGIAPWEGDASSSVEWGGKPKN